MPAVHVSSKFKDKTKILFNGVEVQQLKYLAIKIINDGNTTIQASDFDGPLSLSFGNDAVILSSSVRAVRPSTLNPHIEIERNRVVVSPLSWNANDSFIVKLLVANHEETEIAAQVADIKEVRKITDAWQYIQYEYWIRLWWGAVLSTGVGLVSLIIANWIFPLWSIAIRLCLAVLSMAGAYIRARKFQAEQETEMHSYWSW